MTNPTILLRDVTPPDLPILFEHQLDPVSSEMAAVPRRERTKFMELWTKILADDAVTKKTILFDDHVAGFVARFEEAGRALVAYRLGREYWGKGIATQALAQLLEQDSARPLYAYVAKHNIGSIRVLQKCGFAECAEPKGPPVPGYEHVEELVMKLDA
jgi:RimJ/RimL family protein N-acetyltransferase